MAVKPAVRAATGTATAEVAVPAVAEGAASAATASVTAPIAASSNAASTAALVATFVCDTYQFRKLAQKMRDWNDVTVWNGRSGQLGDVVVIMCVLVLVGVPSVGAAGKATEQHDRSEFRFSGDCCC